MKKSLLALAVLGAFAGAASAQSSVTLFGIVDVNARLVKNGEADAIKQLGTDGINSSRLGFRGVEDLGGGLKAGFWIEGALAPDVGSSGGQTWQRRSTVSLLGGFGEVRLGRDYTPTFWNLTVFDPFGTNGVGSSLNLFLGGVSTAAGSATLVRASNTIGYFLPSGIGGLYGQAQVAAGEGSLGNKYMGGRIGYAAGPIDAAVSYGRTQVGVAGTALTDERYNTWNVGASYNAGVVKVTGFYSHQNSDIAAGLTGDFTQTNWMLGAIVPLGQGEIRASFNKASGKDDLDGLSAKQYAVGYVYNLSKRTALYGQYSRITNDDTAFSVNGGSAAAFDGKSSGAEFGVRHSF
jgi:predicted porin